ncbi:MAG: isoprenylcysteine carboxylmethyltransferase family protein [Halorhabdus sp.]
MASGLVMGALTVAVVVELAVIAAIAVSIVWPEHRVWPPGSVSWKFWYYWGGSTVVFAALTVVAVRDAGSFVLTGITWDVAGGILAVAGFAFAGWAGYTFRMRESFGLEGGLYTDGPYQYSRNPQYVGMVAVLLGVLLIVNSLFLIVGMLPVFIWTTLLPFAEEPWLRDQFGDDYTEYCQSVPRFLGRRTIQRLRK